MSNLPETLLRSVEDFADAKDKQIAELEAALESAREDIEYLTEIALEEGYRLCTFQETWDKPYAGHFDGEDPAKTYCGNCCREVVDNICQPWPEEAPQ